MSQPTNEEVRRALSEAGALQSAGRFADAAQRYRLALRARPDDPELLHAFGVCLLQQGDCVGAEAALAASLRLWPQQPAALTNRGIALHALNRHHDALRCFDDALRLAPQQPETLNMRGLALMALKRYDEALRDFDRALQIAPHFAEIWNSRANALIQLRQYEQALESLDRAEALRPGYGEALSNRSIALNLLRRHEEALAAASRAAALLPGRAVVHRNRADALAGMNRFDEALASCERAIALDAEDLHLHAARAELLSLSGRADEAARCRQRALAMVEERIGRLLAAAPASVRDDADLRWRLAELHFERGQLLADVDDFRGAIAAFVEARAWRPDLVYAEWSEALLRLKLGDYERGWPLYESRQRKPDFANVLRRFDVPPWTGEEDPAGLRILLHAEQGLGDALQFCRYAPLLAARGAHVIVAAHPPLKRLLQSLDGIVEVVADGEPLPPFDRHCPLMSLPYAFRTTLATVPAAAPYLRADPERIRQWQAWLGPRDAPRVGLVWSGNPRHANDRARSISPLLLAPLLTREAQFVALNKEVRDDEREAVARLPLRLAGEHLRDFADTAALVQQLDLVIAVDTSVAHLAGALARPLWILLDTRADFRWLADREDSPWYPTARLFRQRRRGDWAEVLQRVARTLDAFIANGAARDTRTPAFAAATVWCASGDSRPTAAR
jgi:tetratricopeptide (TPR) repeat protein